MTEALAIACAFLLAYTGFTGLSLAMARQHRQLRPAWPLPDNRTRLLYRLGGWSSLILAALASILGWGLAIGTVAYFGVLTAAALVLILLLAYAPQWAGRLAWFGCVGVPLLGVAVLFL